MGALIFRRNSILLVERAGNPLKGYWSLPGGLLETGETLEDGVAREVLEETGLRVTGWSHLVYAVVVDAPDMGWQLRVEAWEAEGVEGDGWQDARRSAAARPCRGRPCGRPARGGGSVRRSRVPSSSPATVAGTVARAPMG